jgi:hypothetical protein
MKLHDATVVCQLPHIGRISEARAESPAQSLGRRLKLVVRRRMSPQTERSFKKHSNDVLNWLCRVTGKPERPTALPTGGSPVNLKAGDRVRVRPRAEIDATLNHWRQLRGCTFMPEMDRYCGTTQWVLKPLERFVDERDLRVKASRGIVLLDGVICQGTVDFGGCDRSCVLFWREEWLEKIDQPSA